MDTTMDFGEILEKRWHDFCALVVYLLQAPPRSIEHLLGLLKKKKPPHVDDGDDSSSTSPSIGKDDIKDFVDSVLKSYATTSSAVPAQSLVIPIAEGQYVVLEAHQEKPGMCRSWIEPPVLVAPTCAALPGSDQFYISTPPSDTNGQYAPKVFIGVAGLAVAATIIMVLFKLVNDYGEVAFRYFFPEEALNTNPPDMLFPPFHAAPQPTADAYPPFPANDAVTMIEVNTKLMAAEKRVQRQIDGLKMAYIRNDGRKLKGLEEDRDMLVAAVLKCATVDSLRTTRQDMSLLAGRGERDAIKESEKRMKAHLASPEYNKDLNKTIRRTVKQATSGFQTTAVADSQRRAQDWKITGIDTLQISLTTALASKVEMSYFESTDYKDGLRATVRKEVQLSGLGFQKASDAKAQTKAYSEKFTAIDDQQGTLEAALSNKADSTELSKILGDVSAINTKQGSLESALSSKADNTKLSKLQGDVAEMNTKQGTLETTLFNKADSTELSKLRGEVAGLKNSQIPRETFELLVKQVNHQDAKMNSQDAKIASQGAKITAQDAQICSLESQLVKANEVEQKLKEQEGLVAKERAKVDEQTKLVAKERTEKEELRRQLDRENETRKTEMQQMLNAALDERLDAFRKSIINSAPATRNASTQAPMDVHASLRSPTSGVIAEDPMAAEKHTTPTSLAKPTVSEETSKAKDLKPDVKIHVAKEQELQNRISSVNASKDVVAEKNVESDVKIPTGEKATSQGLVANVNGPKEAVTENVESEVKIPVVSDQKIQTPVATVIVPEKVATEKGPESEIPTNAKFVNPYGNINGSNEAVTRMFESEAKIPLMSERKIQNRVPSAITSKGVVTEKDLDSDVKIPAAHSSKTESHLANVNDAEKSVTEKLESDLKMPVVNERIDQGSITTVNVPPKRSMFDRVAIGPDGLPEREETTGEIEYLVEDSDDESSEDTDFEQGNDENEKDDVEQYEEDEKDEEEEQDEQDDEQEVDETPATLDEDDKDDVEENEEEEQDEEDDQEVNETLATLTERQHALHPTPRDTIAEENFEFEVKIPVVKEQDIPSPAATIIVPEKVVAAKNVATEVKLPVAEVSKTESPVATVDASNEVIAADSPKSQVKRVTPPEDQKVPSASTSKQDDPVFKTASVWVAASPTWDVQTAKPAGKSHIKQPTEETVVMKDDGIDEEEQCQSEKRKVRLGMMRENLAKEAAAKRKEIAEKRNEAKTIGIASANIVNTAYITQPGAAPSNIATDKSAIPHTGNDSLLSLTSASPCQKPITTPTSANQGLSSLPLPKDAGSGRASPIVDGKQKAEKLGETAGASDSQTASVPDSIGAAVSSPGELQKPEVSTTPLRKFATPRVSRRAQKESQRAATGLQKPDVVLQSNNISSIISPAAPDVASKLGLPAQSALPQLQGKPVFAPVPGPKAQSIFATEGTKTVMTGNPFAQFKMAAVAAPVNGAKTEGLFTGISAAQDAQPKFSGLFSDIKQPNTNVTNEQEKAAEGASTQTNSGLSLSVLEGSMAPKFFAQKSKFFNVVEPSAPSKEVKQDAIPTPALAKPPAAHGTGPASGSMSNSPEPSAQTAQVANIVEPNPPSTDAMEDANSTPAPVNPPTTNATGLASDTKSNSPEPPSTPKPRKAFPKLRRKAPTQSSGIELYPTPVQLPVTAIVPETPIVAPFAFTPINSSRAAPPPTAVKFDASQFTDGSFPSKGVEVTQNGTTIEQHPQGPETPKAGGVKGPSNAVAKAAANRKAAVAKAAAHRKAAVYANFEAAEEETSLSPMKPQFDTAFGAPPPVFGVLSSGLATAQAENDTTAPIVATTPLLSAIPSTPTPSTASPAIGASSVATPPAATPSTPAAATPSTQVAATPSTQVAVTPSAPAVITPGKAGYVEDETDFGFESEED